MRRIITTDFSGIEEYLDIATGFVEIPVANCLLIDECALGHDQTFAIVKVGSRILLLAECGTGATGYVVCDTRLIMDLSYTSLEEALADTLWSGPLQKEIREIDSLAYGLYCDLYR